MFARRVMQTNVRSVYRDRVCEWYYLWSQLSQFPTLSARGIEMALQVVSGIFLYFSRLLGYSLRVFLSRCITVLYINIVI